MTASNTFKPALDGQTNPFNIAMATESVSGQIAQSAYLKNASDETLVNPATSTKQPAIGVAGTASADVLTVQGIAGGTLLRVDGSGATQPISAASLPLPTGAATAAGLTVINSTLGSPIQQTGGSVSIAGTATISGAVSISGTAAVSLATLPPLSAGTAIAGKFGIDQTTPGTTNGFVFAPTSNAGAGLAPVSSTVSSQNVVAKASAGNFYDCTAYSSISGFILIFNATSKPADGAGQTPMLIAPINAGQTASIFSAMLPAVFSIGITICISTAASPFTLTTGSQTSWISYRVV